jgi:hypothetical protein
MIEPRITVKKVKAADPSIAFTLELNEAAKQLPKLEISLILTDQDDCGTIHSSSVVLDNPTNDQMNFIVPFGDSKAHFGKIYNYAITMNAIVVDGTGVTTTGHGRFYPLELADRVEALSGQNTTMLLAGKGIVSLEGDFIGLMQFDGSFTVYQIAGNLPPNPQTPLTTPIKSNIRLGTPALFVDGDGYVYTVGDVGPMHVAIAKSKPAVPNASFVIDQGQFCMQSKIDGKLTVISFDLV